MQTKSICVDIKKCRLKTKLSIYFYFFLNFFSSKPENKAGIEDFKYTEICLAGVHVNCTVSAVSLLTPPIWEQLLALIQMSAHFGNDKWVGKHLHWHRDIRFLEPTATKALGGQNYEKLYSIFPGRDGSETAQFLFMHCHIYYYSNNIQLSNLLDCRLGIREKSRLVKFSARYESFYLKNCPRRNIQFSAVAIQKWGHFIFCPQQDLMEEKKLLLLTFTFYSF